MKMNKRYTNIVFLGLALSLVACGSEDPGDKSPDQTGGAAGAGGGTGTGGTGTGGAVITESLLPFKEGNTWTYRVTEGSETFTKVTVVEAEEPVGGEGPNSEVLANRVTTTKKDGLDKTVSWQKYEDGILKRFREQGFNPGDGSLEIDEYWTPYKLHVDDNAEHTADGVSWIEEYDETKLEVGTSPVTSTKRDVWSVQETDATVTVPAGTFDNAIVLVKSGASTQKTYYYVPGVGKVKELGGQTEELVEYVVE
jgi:hypothetical protein